MKSLLDQANQHLQLIKIKEGNETEEPAEESIRNNTRSIVNFKDMAKKYKVLIKGLIQWGKLQLRTMEQDEQSDDLKEIIQKILEESQKLMIKVKEKIELNKEKLEEVLFLSTGNLVQNQSFSKFFEGNCRISPRKMSNGEEDSKLLIGNQ
jgi:nicotinamide riboside kinase